MACNKSNISKNDGISSDYNQSQANSSQLDLFANLKQSAIAFRHNTNFNQNTMESIVQSNPYYIDLMKKSLILLKHYGFTDDEIVNEFGSLNDGNIIRTALGIYKIELEAINDIE